MVKLIQNRELPTEHRARRWAAESLLDCTAGGRALRTVLTGDDAESFAAGHLLTGEALLALRGDLVEFLLKRRTAISSG